MKNRKIYFITAGLVLIAIALLSYFYTSLYTKRSVDDYPSTSDYCSEEYAKNKKCPTDFCEFGCVGGGDNDIGGCVGGCIPKPRASGN